jgi:chromosome partitioning protein
LTPSVKHFGIKFNAEARHRYHDTQASDSVSACCKTNSTARVLFDCPPSFSLLGYSVLSCCNLVLIPINPDFFAAKGLGLLLNSLRMRIEPFPVPKIGVFMNRAKKPGGSSLKKYSNETQRYLDDASYVLNQVSKERGLKVKLFESPIFDRVGMKRAIQEDMPADFQAQFQSLWNEIQGFLSEK